MRERLNTTHIVPMRSRDEMEKVPVGRDYVVWLSWFWRGVNYGEIPAITYYYSVLSLKKQENVYIIHGMGKKKGVSLGWALHTGVST